MKNYDDFILQVADAPDFPQNIYGKIRFHIVMKKAKIPAATAFLFFMFAGIISFSTNTNKQITDWDFGSEEVVFSQNNSFYALYD